MRSVGYKRRITAAAESALIVEKGITVGEGAGVGTERAARRVAIGWSAIELINAIAHSILRTPRDVFHAGD